MNADGSTKCTVKKEQPVILINNNAHVNMHESITCNIVGSGLRVVEGRGRGGGTTELEYRESCTHFLQSI